MSSDELPSRNPGYSQSRSSPSKLCSRRNRRTLLIKVCRSSGSATNLENLFEEREKNSKSNRWFNWSGSLNAIVRPVYFCACQSILSKLYHQWTFIVLLLSSYDPLIQEKRSIFSVAIDCRQSFHKANDCLPQTMTMTTVRWDSWDSESRTISAYREKSCPRQDLNLWFQLPMTNVNWALKKPKFDLKLANQFERHFELRSHKQLLTRSTRSAEHVNQASTRFIRESIPPFPRVMGIYPELVSPVRLEGSSIHCLPLIDDLLYSLGQKNYNWI